MLQTPFYRTYQFVLKIARHFYSFENPVVISEENAMLKICEILKNNNKCRPLVVTGNTIFKLGLINSLLQDFENKGIKYTYFHDASVNPTIKDANNGVSAYLSGGCDSIIAIGGGSSIDCAKVIGALIANPNKTVDKMKGLLHVKNEIPFFVAVPTTAGTGSETSIAAVIVDDAHHKYALTDSHLMPNYAILDPTLLIDLPSKTTSYTGMDALTHAVEAYIGRAITKKTKSAALEAIRLIKDNLFKSWADGKNLEYRKNMQKASFLAGTAFTRAYVGYVHALAHALGGKYDVSHGLANAVILPYVLEAYGESCYKKLAEITDALSLCEKSATIEKKALTFINWIKAQNRTLEIPEKFDIEYKQKDVKEMVEHACKEGNPLYPVPREFRHKDFEAIYRKVLR